MNTTYRFIGMLERGCTKYYFEVKEPQIGFTADTKVAYIEKQTPYGEDFNSTYGRFTLDEARRCYKALLAKGFKPRDIEEF